MSDDIIQPVQSTQSIQVTRRLRRESETDESRNKIEKSLFLKLISQFLENDKSATPADKNPVSGFVNSNPLVAIAIGANQPNVTAQTDGETPDGFTRDKNHLLQ